MIHESYQCNYNWIIQLFASSFADVMYVQCVHYLMVDFSIHIQLHCLRFIQFIHWFYEFFFQAFGSISDFSSFSRLVHIMYILFIVNSQWFSFSFHFFRHLHKIIVFEMTWLKKSLIQYVIGSISIQTWVLGYAINVFAEGMVTVTEKVTPQLFLQAEFWLLILGLNVKIHSDQRTCAVVFFFFAQKRMHQQWWTMEIYRRFVLIVAISFFSEAIQNCFNPFRGTHFNSINNF